MALSIQEILNNGTLGQKKAVFLFDKNHSNDMVLVKFNLWARYHFPKYFTSKDAPFHKVIDKLNLETYRGNINAFVDIAFRGAAKRQPLDAKILTPNGFVTLGSLNTGDFVIGSDGKAVRIESLSPIIDRPIYRLTTEDGRSTECDSEHLWTVRKMTNVKEKNVTISLQQIMDEGLFYKRTDPRYPEKEFKEYKYALETVKPVELTHQDLPIDPYVLGILLGDGNFNRQYGSARLTCHKDDENHYKNQIKGFEVGQPVVDKRNTNVITFGINNIGPIIRSLGLNVHGNYKFIPEIYLLGDIEQRKALLEGLMDTDGTVGKKRDNGGSTPSFSTTSERLADGVVHLVRSLGGRAHKMRCENNHLGYWRVSMMFTDYKPFRLPRKLNRCEYSDRTFSRIVSIDFIGNKLGRCIKIENEDGLYVTDDYLLTHNTARTKLFLAFCIANDEDHYRRYIKILCADVQNANQIVTDIFNMLISPRVTQLYPEIFQKSDKKREETMRSFTTATGIKMIADTVGTDQRGAIQEESRPDVIWFEDFENRTTLRSAKKTKAIWENMEEARTGLAKNGACLYTCNYISEAGNVHTLVTKQSDTKQVLIIPIIKNGVLAWPDRYTLAEIEQMKQDDEDFEGERLCKPSASKDVLFDRDTLERMPIVDPIRTIAGFNIFKEYNPQHRYGSGHDVAGGVGLDSSTSVFIDFETSPAQVVGTFKNNSIKPEIFGDEIQREGQMFGLCIAGIEKNNHGHATIARVRQLGLKLFKTQPKETKLGEPVPTEYGWHTNALTKPKMLFALAKAVEDGLLLLNDKDLIQECKSYSRNDLMDDEDDARLTTRHFDLLIAAAIAWQMKDFAESKKSQNNNDAEMQAMINQNRNKPSIMK